VFISFRYEPSTEGKWQIYNHRVDDAEISETVRDIQRHYYSSTWTPILGKGWSWTELQLHVKISSISHVFHKSSNNFIRFNFMFNIKFCYFIYDNIHMWTVFKHFIQYLKTRRKIDQILSLRYKNLLVIQNKLLHCTERNAVQSKMIGFFCEWKG
jgi:hypothetical protein